VLFLLLASTLNLAFNVPVAKEEWTGTVHIKADGSIDPPDAPIINLDNVTYTLTSNITSNADGIVVERDNIIIDGNGFAVQGSFDYTTGTHGIYLADREGVNIKNLVLRGFYIGVYLAWNQGCGVSKNNITENKIGIAVAGMVKYTSIYENNTDRYPLMNLWGLERQSPVSIGAH
jgi:hypothetical protein